jgi:hypothetical protein
MDVDFAIWLCGVVLEVLILFRGWKESLLKKYSFFYTHIASVFVMGIPSILLYKLAPKSYPAFYWCTQPVTILTGYGVLFEIFRQALRDNPPRVRSGQKLLVVVFFFAAIFAAFDLSRGGHASWPRAIGNLARNLQYVKGALLAGLLALLVRYRIPLERQLLGLMAGFSLYIGVAVIDLAFLFLPGHKHSLILRRLSPVTYDVALLTWCVSLWTAQACLERQPHVATVQQASRTFATPSFD